MNILGTFYLQEDRLNGSRLYKIFVLEDALCGAVVCGKYASRITAEKTRNKLLMDLAQFREQQEARYEGLVPGGYDFMGQDEENFTWQTDSWSRVTLKENNWLSKVLTKGSDRRGNMNVFDHQGKKRVFSIFAPQPYDQVITLIQQVFPQAELMDTKAQ